MVSSITVSSIDVLVDSSTTIPCEGRPSRQIIRQLVDDATRNDYNSEIYKEVLRSLRATFDGLTYLDGEGEITEVRCIAANPERAVAKVFIEDNLILPLMSVSMAESQSDKDRMRYKPQILARSVWNDIEQRAERIVQLVPKAITINYDLWLWTYYLEDLDMLTDSIHRYFIPDLELETKYSQVTKVFMTNESNESEIVVPDREDRVLRRKFTMEVQTYLPTPEFKLTSTGQIELIVAEMLSD